MVTSIPVSPQTKKVYLWLIFTIFGKMVTMWSPTLKKLRFQPEKNDFSTGESTRFYVKGNILSIVLKSER